MTEQNELRFRRIPMNNGRAIPALGFGALIPDLGDTRRAARAALEAGFRQFDCAERYRNEEAVGEAILGVLQEEGCGAKISSSLRNSGTTTTGLNVSNLRSKLASRGFGSTMPTSILCIRLSRLDRVKIRTREMKTAKPF